ncbi:hypothetical protein [Streptomyces lydicus]|uniref:hypothetical protein n=1 Tax=Streptomyces lydicus TaxID=47763 RepID=UPI003334663C
MTGMDAATEGKFLDGFRQFLAANSNLGPGLVRQVLVVRMAYPTETEEFRVTASRSECGEAISVLFDELQTFFAERETFGTKEQGEVVKQVLRRCRRSQSFRL